MQNRIVSSLVCLIFCGPLQVIAADEAVDFSHDVLPLLKKHCASCHAAGTYKGDLSIDTRESLLRSGAVTAGDLESEFLIRLNSEDNETRMPFGKPALAPAEIETLTAWVKQGLPWQEGFSFAETSAKRPLQLQEIELPTSADWGDHPIDRLVGSYWQEQGVERPESVSERRFVRRAYLDLVGELPDPAVMQTHLADEGTDRRERLIDALLADEVGYAEHWLTFWNDLLRNDYVGTGFIDGGRKQITDWLYRSLRENKPYDQFVRELISPTGDSEGFIRGIRWRGRVNASQIRELQFSQNVGQVFLGINLKCASCHDSFIDDLKLTDAYGLAAVIADQPLEIHRCDQPTGEVAKAQFVYPELGELNPELPRDERLQQLAELLTKEENGRFSRTIVNRIWQRMMGRGIVHPVDVMAGDAWSPELLDYLAQYLVDQKYDLKALIRLIATSQVYAAKATSWNPVEDVEEYVFVGPHVKRMSAEQFMDAIWKITGTGPNDSAVKTGERGDRPVRASLVISDPLMRSLGRPNREQVVTTRPDSLTTLQALDLSNGERLSQMLANGAAKLVDGKVSPDEMVQTSFQLALSRPPSSDELQLSSSLIGEDPSQESVSDYLWVLLMLPEFQLIR